MDIFSIIIGGVSGLVGAATGIIGYVKYKQLHPVEIRQANANAQRQEIDNLENLINLYRGEVDRLYKLVDDERKESAAKVAGIESQLHDVLKVLESVRKRCGGGCFADQNAA